MGNEKEMNSRSVGYSSDEPVQRWMSRWMVMRERGAKMLQSDNIPDNRLVPDSDQVCDNPC